MPLIVYFVVYVLLAFAWRSLLVYRTSGINPVTLSRDDNAYGYVGRVFKAVIVGCLLAVLVNAIPELAPELVPIPFLSHRWIALVGWVLLLSALVWVLIAQAQMGLSWRIGIDESNTTDLVEKGLFSVSRNPIFLSMRITLLGLVFVAPSAATLVLFVAGNLVVQVQVRLEEEHLLASHPEQYPAYRARVRRWL